MGSFFNSQTLNKTLEHNVVRLPYIEHDDDWARDRKWVKERRVSEKGCRSITCAVIQVDKEVDPSEFRETDIIEMENGDPLELRITVLHTRQLLEGDQADLIVNKLAAQGVSVVKGAFTFIRSKDQLPQLDHLREAYDSIEKGFFYCTTVLQRNLMYDSSKLSRQSL